LRPDRLASMDTQTINLDSKSILAKLIATENIQVQHNKVKTASFDTKHRVLTLPVFKNQKGDVYDMLIAHECAHALHTPSDGWAKIEDDSLRSYVNVLEDCRIDRIIQKQYPGVVKNYLNGFDILEKQNFFGTKGKDLNKELMLIDKINLFYKSSKRLPISFSAVDNNWLSKVDALKTFDDVVDLAKLLLNWQKKEVEKLKKLPEFDNHPVANNYNLNDDESEDESNGEESSENGQGQEAEDNGEDKKDSDEQTAVNSEAKEGGGKGVAPGVLVSITNENMESKMSSLHDQEKSYAYFTLPKVKLNDMIVSNNKFLGDMRKHILDCTKKYPSDLIYYNWLKGAYKDFKNENKKTVMYLVKEFEMKKAATAYKRSSTDKTGTIDPLKLKDYKFSDDIFKRLTILPDAKNHGMMMLLDWSGSMCDSIKQTTEQLMNLVWFCQKVNIPYEVYFFTSEIGESAWSTERQSKQGGEVFTYKYGDAIMDKCHLVCIANNRMKKTKLDESLMYIWSMALSYHGRYSSHTGTGGRMWEGDNFNCPSDYYLGSTPLNQAIVALNEMIPVFKNKNKIEKMSVITLTDGGANWCFGSTMGDDNKTDIVHGSTPVIKVGKKSYTIPTDGRFYRSNEYTGLLLDIIRQRHGVSTIGFFVTKKLRTWDMDNYIGDYKDYQDKELKRAKIKSSMTKNRFAQVPQTGYSKYFLLNGKKMVVENTNLDGINDTMKAGGIAKLFKKSMKGRITSRILLNQFIQEVA
jgi:hypothetical protein